MSINVTYIIVNNNGFDAKSICFSNNSLDNSSENALTLSSFFRSLLTNSTACPFSNGSDFNTVYVSSSLKSTPSLLDDITNPFLGYFLLNSWIKFSTLSRISSFTSSSPSKRSKYLPERKLYSNWTWSSLTSNSSIQLCTILSSESDLTALDIFLNSTKTGI